MFNICCFSVAFLAPKVAQTDKLKFSGQGDDKPTISGVAGGKLKDEKLGDVKEGEEKGRKTPVQPEIKKVEDKWPKLEDDMDHAAQGSTKIRGKKEQEKMTEQVQKPPATAGEKSQANAQSATIATSDAGHGLLKSPSNNIKMITDEEFATANSHQKDQSNASLPQKGSLPQERNQEHSNDGNLKDGIKITSKAPTSKVPMLINITFPQQLQTRNNSMIQITVGDDGLSKTNLPEQAGFKTVVNFSGRTDHVATSDEEFFDKEDRNGKQHEGNVNADALKFVGENSMHNAQPAVGYKLNDFAFDMLKQSGTFPNVGKGAMAQNASLEEAPTVFTETAANMEPQHMFQDRKGMNSKNGDNSVTYLKIAKKLMHDKDTNDNLDYFIPKQLDGEATTAFSRERNDYGFTDQSNEEDNSSNRNKKVKPSSKTKLKKEGRKKKIVNKLDRESNESLKNSWKNHYSGIKGTKEKYSNKKNKWNKGKQENKEIEENKGTGVDKEDDDDEKSVKDNENRDNEKKYKENKDDWNKDNENKSNDTEDNENKDHESVDSESKDSENEENGNEDSENKDNEDKDYKTKDSQEDVNASQSPHSRNSPGSSEEEDDYSVSKTEGFKSKGEAKEIKMHGNHSTLKLSNRKVKSEAFKEKGFTKNRAKGSRFGSNEGDYQKEIAEKISHSRTSNLVGDESKNDNGESKIDSDTGKLSTSNEKSSQRKIASTFSMKPKQSVKFHSSNEHLKTKYRSSGFTPYLQEAQMNAGQITKGQKYVLESNSGKVNANKFYPERTGTTNQGKSHSGADLERLQANRGRHMNLHENEVGMIANQASSSESISSSMYSSMHQPSKEGKDQDLSDRSDNRKFLKSMNSEILDHRIEKQKQMHGKLESNNFSNLDDILAKQVSTFHKILDNKEKANDLAEKEGSLSINNGVDDRKVKNNFKQSVEKEQTAEFFIHNNGTNSSSHVPNVETENGIAKFTEQSHGSYGGWKGQMDQTSFADNPHKENIHLEVDGISNNGQYQLYNHSTRGMLLEGNFTSENETVHVNQTETLREDEALNALLGIDGNMNTTSENEMQNATGKMESENKQADVWERIETHKAIEQNSNRSDAANLTHSNYSYYEYTTNQSDSNFYSDKNNSISPAVVGQNGNITNQDEANNATIINVGTGFIKIKYEKPSVTNPVMGTPDLGENDHLIHRESPTTFTKNSDSLYSAYNMRGPEYGTKELERDDQSGHASKFGNLVNERWSNSTGYNRVTPFYGVGSFHNSSNEQSFSPVINRKDSHHFVIQITPTNSVDGEKKSGGGTGKIENIVSSFNHYKEDSEFEDVSKIKHVPRMKFRDNTTDDSDITEDLMSDNVRASTKKDEDVQAYVKNGVNGDLGLDGSDHRQETSFAQPASSPERQSLYKPLYQQPSTRPYDLPVKQRTSSSRKFTSDQVTATGVLFTLGTAEHRNAQEGDIGINKTAVSSPVYRQGNSDEQKQALSPHVKGIKEDDLQSGQTNEISGLPEKRIGETWKSRGTTEGDIQKQDSQLSSQNTVQQGLGQNKTFKPLTKSSFADDTSDIFRVNHNSGSRLFAKYDSSDIITNDNQNVYENVKPSYSGDESSVDKKLPHKEDWNLAKSADRLEGKIALDQNVEGKHSKSMQSAQMINDKKLFSSVENILKQERISNGHSKEVLADIAEKALNGLSVSNSQNFHKTAKNGREQDEGSNIDNQDPSKDGSYSDAKGNGITENVPSSSKPVCKSNCESLPLRHVSSSKEDESNVVGLNLLSGYDRFSGFHKFYDNEDLVNRRVEAHTESPAFLRDKSIGYDRSGNVLIFIPEEGKRFRFNKCMYKTRARAFVWCVSVCPCVCLRVSLCVSLCVCVF